MKLYHATSMKNLEAMRETGGVLGPSCWAAWPELADYYAETVADDGDLPVVLEVEISDLDEQALLPDLPSLEEPIMTVIRSIHDWGYDKDEDFVMDEWLATERTWRDCLKLAGAVRYDAFLPIDKVSVDAAPVTECFPAESRIAP